MTPCKKKPLPPKRTEPKEYPIMFSSQMVQAILSGKKTVTRRLMRPQPADIQDCDHPYSGRGWKNTEYKCKCIQSPYQKGDTLWVRENWRIIGWDNNDVFLRIEYEDGVWKDIEQEDVRKFDIDIERFCEESSNSCVAAGIKPDSIDEFRFTFTSQIPTKWRSKIHMYRWASRIDLTVSADMRYEKLNEMAEADAVKEGVSSLAEYRELWNSLHPEAKAETNPFVSVTEFLPYIGKP